MNRTSQIFRTLLLGIIINILVVLNSASAQLAVKLEAEPEPPDKEIRLGTLKVLTLQASTNQAVTFEWRLDGPGELDEEDSTPLFSGNFYTLPDRLEGEAESAKVVITVIVTDNKTKETASSKLELTLLASIEELLSITRSLIEKKERWTTPPENNAFDLCKEILSIDSENLDAKQKLYEIKSGYVGKIEEALEKDDKKKVKTYSQGYRKVAQYITDTFQDLDVKEEMQNFEKRLVEIIEELDESKEQQLLCDKLEKAFERYRDLREQEQTHEVSAQILDVIRNISDTLQKKEGPVISPVPVESSMKGGDEEQRQRRKLKALSVQFEQAHSALNAAQDEEERILRTLNILEALRELKGIYAREGKEATENITKLGNTINRYEEEFLSE